MNTFYHGSNQVMAQVCFDSYNELYKDILENFVLSGNICIEDSHELKHPSLNEFKIIYFLLLLAILLNFSLSYEKQTDCIRSILIFLSLPLKV